MVNSLDRNLCGMTTLIMQKCKSGVWVSLNFVFFFSLQLTEIKLFNKIVSSSEIDKLVVFKLSNETQIDACEKRFLS